MSYWGVNFLQTWRGYNDRSLEFDGRLVPDGATVGTSPSPQRVDPPEAICTDDFRLRCEREGFVGLCFEPVWLRTTPNTIVQLEGMKRDARGIVPAKCDPRSRYFSAKAFLKEFPDGAYKSYVPDMNPLSWCLLIGNDSLANVRALIKHNPAWLVQPDSVDPQNASVYQLRQFDLAYIKLFNRYGVSWNRQISTGITAFYKAVTHPRTPIASLRAMLAAGADATLLTLVGNTALHELLDDFFTIPPATILQRCKLLLAAGTRFDAINRFALTPIDLFDNITEQHDAHSSGRKQLRKALVALAAAQGVHVPTYEQRSDSNREPRSRAERKRREALFRRAMGW